MSTINLKDEIDRTLSTSWNVHDHLKDCDLETLQSIQYQDSLPYSVCIVNLFGDLNVGIIMRTAAIMGAEKVIVFGRKKYDKRSTVGAHKYLNLEFVDGMLNDYDVDPDSFYFVMERNNYYPIFIEQGGEDIDSYDWSKCMKVGLKPCLVLGNEGDGIPDSLMNIHNDKVSIEQLGVIRSMNVSSAATIAMYNVSRHLQSYVQGNCK